MKFARGLLLYSVRCIAYSNSHQGCWGSLIFVNDKDFNILVIVFFVQSNTFLMTLFLFLYSFLTS